MIRVSAALTALIRPSAALAIIAAFTLASPSLAVADPLDEVGPGSRAAGMAGTYVANAEGADAAHHNPAGVALAEFPSLLLGYGFGTMQLSINGRDAEVLDAHGATIGAALPLRLTDDVTVAAGMSMYLPDQFIARVQLVPPTEPHFILLDNDPHRLVIEPVVAIKLGRYAALGAGVSIFGDARGDGITFNVGIVGGEKVGEAALDAGLPARLAPLLGVLLTPTPRVRAGFMYRGELSLDLALDIVSNVDVAGVVTGDVLVSIRASNYFTPQRATGGVAVDVLPDLTVSGQLSWANWAAYPSGLADLSVLLSLDLSPPLVQTAQPPAGFTNTLEGRVGAEYRFGGPQTRYALRGGYAYVPTPVPNQVALTSFADNDRHTLALGFGLTLADYAPLLTRPIDLSIGLQWQHLQKRMTVKDAMQFPGEAFSSAGDIVHLGTSMTVSF